MFVVDGLGLVAPPQGSRQSNAKIGLLDAKGRLRTSFSKQPPTEYIKCTEWT
ncbi:hypothetical protein [Eisenibacter elegans]|uniref:hypothetical protein n=1 Tax=Eisenibacter elegans TaxID=997 RepID=UPI000408C344|nr:hypothetical protein [Eisenibacter elegans]